LFFYIFSADLRLTILARRGNAVTEFVLLGAGASIDAGVPGACGMTKNILGHIRSKTSFRREAHALSYVVGGLLFQAGRDNVNPLEPTVNVEDLFNAVQLLGQRDALEAAPFIGSWHSFVEELDKIYPSQRSGDLQRLIYDSVSRQIQSAFSQSSPSFGRDKIDKALSSALGKGIEAAVNKRSLHLGFADSVGRAVEDYLKEIAQTWSRRLQHPSFGADKIGEHITREIRSSQPRSGQGEIFLRTNELMIAALKDLTWIDDATKVAYLFPLLNLQEKQGRVAIATLNYDNSVELLCDSTDVACETGISEWSRTGHFDIPGSGLRLLKLHGSIDWLYENCGSGDGQMPLTGIRQVTGKEVKSREFKPAVIFGNRNKLTAEGPFLDLLRAFQDELSRTDMLTVVGYSFRDAHINVYISQWLNGDVSRILRIVNGSDFARRFKSSSDCPSYVCDLAMVAATDSKRVQVLDDGARAGLERLYGTRTVPLRRSSPSPSQTALNRMAEEIDAGEADLGHIGDSDVDGTEAANGEEASELGVNPDFERPSQ
jgi:hypothetical protein